MERALLDSRFPELFVVGQFAYDLKGLFFAVEPTSSHTHTHDLNQYEPPAADQRKDVCWMRLQFGVGSLGRTRLEYKNGFRVKTVNLHHKSREMELINNYLLAMEEKSSSLLALPRRGYNLPVQFHPKSRKTCITNYFSIDIGGKMTSLYQFSIDFEPAIPQDSKDLLHAAIRSVKKQVKDKIQMTTYSGNMLWGLKQLSIPLNVKSEFVFDQKPYKFDMIIKPTKTLQMNDLLKTEQGKKMAYQVFNNKIKQVLKERDMDELTRGKYFDNKEILVKKVGLSIIRGFKFTLCTLKSGLFLQIDVCSRVFRSANLLEEITNKRNKDFADSLIGSTIITNYGRRRTYKINNFCHDLTPLSKFYNDKRAGMISYADYYKESYGLSVYSKNQPLIQVILREQKRIDKGVMVKTEIKGHLLPEFVSLTGMSDEQRADYNTMKEIAPFTKLMPEERMTQTDQIIKTLNEEGKFNIAQPKRIQAYQLNQPYVEVSNKQVVKNHGDGSMNIRDTLKTPISFKDWVVVYSYSKNPKYDDQDADNLVNLLGKASQAFGVKFDQPGFITCDPNNNSWKNQLKADIQKNGKPQIIVLFFNQFEEKFYGNMKELITCELKLPCQAIRKRTITKSKNPLSAASKIVIQMNQKAGGTAWKVIQEPDAYTVKKRTMYGAFAISKGKKGFTLAFNGTINNEFTRGFSYCKTGYKTKQTIPQADFEAILVNWAKNYVGVNKKGPELILIYRQGLSIQQIERQVKSELEALNNVIKKVGQKIGNTSYQPEIIYTIVNTKINTRIFDLPEGSSQNRSNKFQPKAVNPQSGTCVFDELSVDEMYDFHLAAQRVTEGTCTPTHYIVAYNSSKMPQEDLAQFTYEQCFNYYNWSGAVKVPASLQCANKLAKLVGQSMQADVTTGQVQTSFFFL